MIYLLWEVILILLLFGSSCTSPSKFDTDKYAATPRDRMPPSKSEATALNSGKALVRGQIKEYLAFQESRALEAEKKATTSSRPQPNLETASAAYREASRAARFSGQTQKMLTYAEKSLEMAQKTGVPEHIANSIALLVLAYEVVGNDARVSELLEEGFEIVRSFPGPPQDWKRPMYEAAFYNLVGRYHLRRLEYEAAVKAFSGSVGLYESFLNFFNERPIDPIQKQEIRSYLLLSITGLGYAYFGADKLEDALATYQRGFKLMEEWKLEYLHGDQLYQGMGDIYVRQNQFPSALDNYNKALALAERQGTTNHIISLKRRIGYLLMKSGNPSEAIPYLEMAIQLVESARALLQAQGYRQSYFEGRLDAYAMMIEACVGAGKGEEAFDYSERARSRGFLDVLGSKVQLSKSRSGLIEEERTLQEHIASIKISLSGQGEWETKRPDLQNALAEAEKAYSDFLGKVRKQDKEQASLMTVEPLKLKQVQELLDPDTTLIEYFVTERNTYVWLVEKEKSKCVRVDLPRAQINDQVKALHNAISALGQREKFDQISASLYNQLIEPLLPYMTGKELIIVPHDTLHYLPFHALLSPNGHYLVEDYPVYYLSSASLIQFTKEKRAQRGELSSILAKSGKVLAFGNPDLGDPSMDLKFAELEAREVGNSSPKSTVLLRGEATEEKSKSLSPEYDVVHFATHSELNEEDPTATAILLVRDEKEDGRLQVREIFGMDLKANMVVLSACETGLGKLSRGDELVGLTRAFNYAGTPSVVASLWKVDDSSTTVLMGSFYRNLKTMSKVEALRQAQLELIRGQTRSDSLKGQRSVMKKPEVPEGKFSHPYFWAPFILVGEAR